MNGTTGCGSGDRGNPGDIGLSPNLDPRNRAAAIHGAMATGVDDGTGATTVQSEQKGQKQHAQAARVYRDTGDVRCWGDNANGQLGAGDSLSHFLGFSPTAVADLGRER